MSSEVEPKNNFKSNLLEILKDLAIKNRGKKELLEYYIKERLNKSLNTYYESLLKSQNRILHKNTLKVVRSINKNEI